VTSAESRNLPLKRGRGYVGCGSLHSMVKSSEQQKTQCDTFKKIGARAVMPSGITGIKKEEYRRMVIFNYI